MTFDLLYGRSGLNVTLNSKQVKIIRQTPVKALENEKAGFFEALQNPTASQPLDSIISDGQKIAVIIPDGTRPLPSQKLIQWLLEALSSKKDLTYSIILGTGSHRPNTHSELMELLGAEILHSCEVINHVSTDFGTMTAVGERDGGMVYMNKAAVEADIRIAMGFIEPHLWAGFSGGYKAVMPGITDIDTIKHYHRGEIITDSRCSWGRISDNPTQEMIRRYGQLLPIDFLINVSMNHEREIVTYFCGDPILAHEAGCEAVKREAMTGVAQRYPIVITTNNGFPLDQNLYQAGKGLSAAAQIVEDGGMIILACACSDGFPHGSNFHRLLTAHSSPAAILDHLDHQAASQHDQWSVHFLASLLTRYRIVLYSQLSDEEVRAAHLIPTNNIARTVEEELDRIGYHAPVAVLPEGFQCIPYVFSPKR